MNIYDTKTVFCKSCERSIGEIEYDAEVILPKCGSCADIKPEGDKILYTVSAIQHPPRKRVIVS